MSGSRTRRSIAVALAVTASALTVAAGANAHVTPGQAQWSVERGADWFQTTQQADGALGSDWAMTALAAAGRNAADVRTTLLAPSAQDHYLDTWRASGPGGVATDAARAILAGTAGGIQTSRLSTAPAAERSNLVARIAELWDGTQIGSTGLLNDDIFGVLALHHAGAPNALLERIAEHIRGAQLADGGWSWSASASSADTDMTASAVGALCASGAGPEDPDVQEALALLHDRQDAATGGFAAPPWTPVNTDTTAWAASALIQCGIDPQSEQWTTDQDKTPLDYLISVQQPDGHFDWSADQSGSTVFATFDAMRPLGGIGWSTAAPERLDPSEPAVRSAAAVAAGTTVPITLVIDHGPGADDVRMCRVDIAEGSTLAEALASAEQASTPAGCVTEATTAAESGGAIAVERVNGVARDDDWTWWVRLDGAERETATSESLGLGDLVFLSYAGVPAPEPPAGPPADPPEVDVPPVEPPETKPAAAVVRHYPMVRLGALLRVRRGRVLVPVRCPRGNGSAGCRGMLRLHYRTRPAGAARFRGRGVRGGLPRRARRPARRGRARHERKEGIRRGRPKRPFRYAGAAAYALASGDIEAVRVRLPRPARRALVRGRVVRLRLAAATRAEDGLVRVTRGRRLLTPRR